MPGLKKNYPESFEDGIGLDPTFFNGFFQGLSFLLCNLILFFRGEGGDNLVLKFSSVFGFFAIILLIVLILFFETHAIRFEEEVFPSEMLNILEVGFELLGEFFDGEELLALLGGFELAFGHV